MLELIAWQNIRPVFYCTGVRKLQSIKTIEARRCALKTSCIREDVVLCRAWSHLYKVLSHMCDPSFTRTLPSPTANFRLREISEALGSWSFRWQSYFFSPSFLLSVVSPLPHLSLTFLFSHSFSPLGWQEECVSLSGTAGISAVWHQPRIRVWDFSSCIVHALVCGVFGIFMHFSSLGPLLDMRDARVQCTLDAWCTYYLRHR